MSFECLASQSAIAVFTVETTVANEKAKKSKSKEPFSVTWDDNADFEWNFKVTKAATTVTKTTLDKHSKQQTTLPDDLHYDAKQLLKLFSMPSVMVRIFSCRFQVSKLFPEFLFLRRRRMV